VFVSGECGFFLVVVSVDVYGCAHRLGADLGDPGGTGCKERGRKGNLRQGGMFGKDDEGRDPGNSKEKKDPQELGGHIDGERVQGAGSRGRGGLGSPLG